MASLFGVWLEGGRRGERGTRGEIAMWQGREGANNKGAESSTDTYISLGIGSSELAKAQILHL